MSAIQCVFGFLLHNYVCKIFEQTIKKDSQDLKGKHKDGQTVNNVDRLSFFRCHIQEIPMILKESYPNLTLLYVSDCQLKNINREDIGAWKMLTEIIIINCGLIHLKGDIFRDLKRLTYVRIKDNGIVEIEPDIFDGLKKLKVVDFSRNVNINMRYSSNLIKDDLLETIKNDIIRYCKPKNQVRLTDGTQKSINNKLSAVFANPAFKDFTMNVENSSFRVHKVLFAAHSPTLSEIFENNPEVQELNLRDIPEATFKVVHDFIYTGELPNDANYIEVYAAAKQLKIDELIEAAVEFLLENIDENNCYQVLLLSNKFKHSLLRDKAFDFIRKVIFPDRQIDDELAMEPEKLANIIEAKKTLDREFYALSIDWLNNIDF